MSGLCSLFRICAFLSGKSQNWKCYDWRLTWLDLKKAFWTSWSRFELSQVLSERLFVLWLSAKEKQLVFWVSLCFCPPPPLVAFFFVQSTLKPFPSLTSPDGLFANQGSPLLPWNSGGLPRLRSWKFLVPSFLGLWWWSSGTVGSWSRGPWFNSCYLLFPWEHAVVKSIVVSTIRENRIKIIFYVLPEDKTGFYEFSLGS